MIDALRTALEGSLPEETITIRVSDGSFADWRRVEDRALLTGPKRRRKPQRKGMSQDDFAAFVGCHRNTVRSQFGRDDELRRLLGIKPGGKWPALGIAATDEQKKAAATHLLHARGLVGWAPRARLLACVRCQKNDTPHYSRGLCTRCAFTDRRRAAGRKQRDLSMWDSLGKHRACTICRRSDVAHASHGRCWNCDNWARRARLDSFPKKTQERMRGARARFVKARAEKKQAREMLKRGRHE